MHVYLIKNRKRDDYVKSVARIEPDANIMDKDNVTIKFTDKFKNARQFFYMKAARQVIRQYLGDNYTVVRLELEAQ